MKKYLVPACAVILITLLFFIPARNDAQNAAHVFYIPEHVATLEMLRPYYDKMTPCSITRIIDGDTIVASFDGLTDLSASEKVRLIGVDTPETRSAGESVSSLGILAAQYVEGLVLDTQVRLAFEKKLRDRYGRLLAYIFLDDGSCLNLSIVSEGYSMAYTKYPFLFRRDFMRAEQDAARNKKGLWLEVRP